MKFDIDDIDLKILRLLQSDATISNTDLAERVGLSQTPCARRVRLLKEYGFFGRSVTLLSPNQVGLSVNVFAHITMNHQKKENLKFFEKLVSTWPEVMECYLMTGEFDYLIRVVVPDLPSYQQFVDKLTEIDTIQSIKSSFSLKQVQYKTELPLDHLNG